ncbi:MAG TPA: hypothetical protein VGW34_07775 [Allosphingosinicella sp.]|nr:hypothetical protein [Allosphingosinicella sp.]
MIGFDAAAVAAQMTAGIDLFDPRFPRNLAKTAPLTLPVSVTVELGLTTAKVAQVLGALTGRSPRDLPVRRLRGCLIAHRGNGMIFLDADDEGLLRFAAAHEIAHFVGHYLARRELAIARLGSNIVEVLDGARHATATERLGGILSGCPLGVFTDVMARDEGAPLNAVAERMEYEADDAAFLAIAPVGLVIARTIEREGEVNRKTVRRTLIDAFGLAPRDAGRHAPRVINAMARSRPSLVDELRKAASEMANLRHK